MLGEKIRLLLKSERISQKEAAESLGIDVARLNSYINNKALPNYLMLIKIADYFGISLDELTDHTVGTVKGEKGVSLTEQEEDLLSTFRKLDRRGRYKALAACYDELDHMKLREKEQAEERAKSLVSVG